LGRLFRRLKNVLTTVKNGRGLFLRVMQIYFGNFTIKQQTTTNKNSSQNIDGTNLSYETEPKTPTEFYTETIMCKPCQLEIYKIPIKSPPQVAMSSEQQLSICSLFSHLVVVLYPILTNSVVVLCPVFTCSGLSCVLIGLSCVLTSHLVIPWSTTARCPEFLSTKQ
jgi:hypothetical protein